MDGVARREALITQWSHPLSCRFPLANIKWSSDTSGESPNALTPWSSGRPVRSQVQPCEWHIARALSRRRIITRLVDKLRQWEIKRRLNGKQLFILEEKRLSEKRDFSFERYFQRKYLCNLSEIFSRLKKIFLYYRASLKIGLSVWIIWYFHFVVDNFYR